MIGRDPTLVVTQADDAFHPPTSEAASWVETMWFPCWVPEEGGLAAGMHPVDPNQTAKGLRLPTSQP